MITARLELIPASVALCRAEGRGREALGQALGVRVPAGARELLGVAGHAGPPSADGAVEIGYALAKEYRGRGYATEAIEALVAADDWFSTTSLRQLLPTALERGDD